MDDIYRASNIARSRERAQRFRELVKSGDLPSSWLETAADMEAYADEREANCVDA